MEEEKRDRKRLKKNRDMFLSRREQSHLRSNADNNQTIDCDPKIRGCQWRSKGGNGGGPPRAAFLGGGKIEAIPKNLGRGNYFEG